MLLLHGGGVGPWMWDRVASRLAPGFHVDCPSLPGHGHAAHLSFTTQEEVAKAIAADVNLAGANERVTFVGFSLGGQVALQLAAMHADRVERLVIISSLLEPMPGAEAYAWLVRATAGLASRPWFARLQARQLGVPDELFDAYLESARVISRATLTNLTRANMTFDARPLLDRFMGKTLFMAGSQEPRVVLAGARRLAERNGLEVQVVPGAGHTLPLTHPEIVAEAIRTT